MRETGQPRSRDKQGRRTPGRGGRNVGGIDSMRQRESGGEEEQLRQQKTGRRTNNKKTPKASAPQKGSQK